MRKQIILVLLALVFVNAESFKTIGFSGTDSLEITADLYAPHDEDAPFILMFHRARWSRGEYRELAPEFNKRGYNCLAVDQRSGERINDVPNETYKRAKSAGVKTEYIDAYKDMQAAFSWVRKNYKPSKIIVWGSSYSSALVFRLAAENQLEINAVIAFSPGEYFADQGESDQYIGDYAKKVNCPVFVTSAANEKNLCESIYNSVQHQQKIYFLPEKDGFHGSEALWKKHRMSSEYWTALNDFLNKYIE